MNEVTKIIYQVAEELKIQHKINKNLKKAGCVA